MKKKNKPNEQIATADKIGVIPIKTLVIDENGCLQHKTKLFLGDKGE